MTDSLKYRADIDGMRAVAVLLVLLFHFSLVSAINAGFLGVDVFFVISGFLITAILVKQLDTSTFSLRVFYINRIRRLGPALFVVLLLVISAGVWWLFPNQLVDLSKQALASQLYVANIYYWRSINYFGFQVHDVFLLHTWSLAVEEQFYLIYPACLWLLHRYLKAYFWPVIVLSCLISFGLNVLFMTSKPEATFYLLPTRAWELLIGALVARIVGQWTASKNINEILGLLGACLIAIGALCYRRDFHIPGFYALLPAVGTACLLLTGHKRATVVAKFLGWAPIVYIGRISYSLYLVHWPLNVFARNLIEDYSPAWRLAMFALSIVLAALIYHTIEEPIRHKRNLVTNRKLLAGYVAGLVFTVSSVAVVQVSGGLPQRFPANVVRLASYAHETSAPLDRCEFLGQPLKSPSSFCQIGVSDRNPTWLIYGDSHAWAARTAFDKWLKLTGQSGLLIFYSGCPPVNGIYLFGDKGLCFAFNKAVLRFIESNANLHNIVLVSTWRQAIEGILSKSPYTLPTKEESVQLFKAQFSQTLERLHELRRHVYVWEPVPGASKSVPLAMARAAWEHRPTHIEFDVGLYFSTYRFFFDALKENQQWITGTFSPSQALCSTGKCAVSHDGIPLYSDNAHMTESTADFWVRVLQHSQPAR